uniref:Uncharacterized protein n=1 Tax=Lepeophtheirus salmonis TaxID=72036 RepID=A0A0K2UK80_LEPSM
MIAMHTVSKLNAETIKKLSLMKLPSHFSLIGFKVHSTIYDSHKINQKTCSSELCHENLGLYIFKPYSPKSKIYLLFDSVYGMKNFFNNFLSRTHLELKRKSFTFCRSLQS